jgi:spermidine synthase
MAIELFSLGLITLLGQVVLMRELIVAFFGVELVYVLAMGTWLLGSAAGAAIGRREHVPSASTLKGLFVVFSLLLPGLVVFCRGLRLLFSAVPGAYLPFGQQMLALGLALLPAAVVSGLIFQWAAKRYTADGKTLAAAYALESAGGLVGGAAATGLLYLGLQNLSIAVLCALAAAATAVFTPYREGRSRLVFAAAAVSAAALLFAGAARETLDRSMTGWNHPSAVTAKDSPYGRITITGEAGRFALFENGALVFDTEGTEAESFVHLAALQHPAPKKVLLIGGGVSGHLAEIRKHRPDRIDDVEVNPVLLQEARSVLPRAFTDSLNAEGVRVVVADPRRFLAQSADDDYDLILAVAAEPLSGETNRFYTREFFRACARHLAPNGVFAFQLAAAENLWPRPLIFRNASVHRAASDVFSDVLVLPGTVSTVVAANRPLERRPEPLIRRFEQRRIDARLVSPAYIGYQLTNDRTEEIAALLAAADAPANTDKRPICYPYSLMVWLSQFFPEMINELAVGGGVVPIWPVLPAAGLLFFLCRKSGRIRQALLSFSAGLLGMILETLLILQYQVKSGVLYQDIGLLLTAFMAGMAVGAPAMVRAAGPGSGGGRPRAALGRLVAAGFGLLGLVIFFGVRAGALGGMGSVGLLLFASGFLVSALFAFAGLHSAAERQGAVPRLLASDLLGGCAGSVAASLVAIPFLGMDQTAWLAALLAAAMGILI